MIKNGAKVRIVKDCCGRIPVRYMKRIGIIVRRKNKPDDNIQQFYVKFKDRKEPLLFWIDEFILVEDNHAEKKRIMCVVKRLKMDQHIYSELVDNTKEEIRELENKLVKLNKDRI